MPKTTSFVLDDHFDNMIASQIKSGRFGSASEVVREGLRLVEERQKRLDALNAAIDDGLTSGVAKDFSWSGVKATGRKRAATS